MLKSTHKSSRNQFNLIRNNMQPKSLPARALQWQAGWRTGLTMAPARHCHVCRYSSCPASVALAGGGGRNPKSAIP